MQGRSNSTGGSSSLGAASVVMFAAGVTTKMAASARVPTAETLPATGILRPVSATK